MRNDEYRIMIVSIFFLMLSAVAIGTEEIKTPAIMYLIVNQPEQITSETEPVLHFAVSRDARQMVYTAGRDSNDQFMDIWLRSADPSRVFLPRRLTFDPSAESSPTFSPDGNIIAYVGTSYDVKGDIFLLNLKSEKSEPVRLTGRDTEDGAPCFSPDGKTLYFHQAVSGGMRKIVAMPIHSLEISNQKKELKIEISQVDIKGDGAFPKISPDGNYLAFVTFRNDPSGDIFVMNMKTGNIIPLTQDNFMDFFPAWYADSKTVYFSKFGLDTNRDGKITASDNAAIYRAKCEEISVKTEEGSVKKKEEFLQPSPFPYPVTSSGDSAYQPHISGDRLFFLSSRGGVINCWWLPIDGEIPIQATPAEQAELAKKISRRVPFDPYLTVLAWYKVLENFPEASDVGAASAYAIGKVFQKINMPDAAVSAFRIVNENFSSIQPEASLSLITQTVIYTKKMLDEAKSETQRKQILDDGLSAIKSISHDTNVNPIIMARAEIECARLLLDYAKDSAALLQAIKMLDDVIENSLTHREDAAEAMILKADIFGKTGMSENVYPIYIAVIDRYRDIDTWIDVAVERVLNIVTSDYKSTDEKVQTLRRVSDENCKKMPILSIGALNRVGDLYFAEGDWLMAKSAYRQVLDQFPILTNRTAAARLSLAEILYREERFQQALSLYETEIDKRPDEDNIYQLARAGYIRKSIAAGEYLFRLGEINTARKTFRELIEYDYYSIEALRGYIKCAAAMMDIKPVLDYYRERMDKNPADPIATYATALCMTYLNDRTSLKYARQLLLRAIGIDGRSEYFHQTLGYVLEVLETVYGEKGKGLLEMALESYKKAYFLNDHTHNAQNAANLLLNIGNAYYLLNQYESAFKYYTMRLESGQPFDNPNTEILFYRRLGTSAFQSKETEKTVSAFTKSLELIDSHMEPQKASQAFDRICRYVMDRIAAPGMKIAEFAERAKIISKGQSEINRQLFQLTIGDIMPPPAPSWNIYRKAIENLLIEQEKHNTQISLLIRKTDGLELKEQEVRDTLYNMIINVRTALEFPERLVVLKAEMLDRLGLAYQEAQEWEKAINTFEAVYNLNEQMQQYENLAKNRRSVAYNAYMLAETLSGEMRDKILRDSSRDFASVIDLVKKYPNSPSSPPKQSGGLFNISLAVSLDDTSVTQAAHGFSDQQEIRLAEAFISRIHTELNELIPAQKALKEQLELYPPEKPVSDKDAYGVSLLYHRAGHIYAATQQPEEAFKCFHRSAELSLRLKNPVSTAINVTNMATIMNSNNLRFTIYDLQLNHKHKLSFSEKLSLLNSLDQQTTSLLAENTTGNFSAVYHNTMGVYNALNAFNMMKNEPGIMTDDIHHSSSFIIHHLKAITHFLQALDAVEKSKSFTSIGLGSNAGDSREKYAFLATVHLNIAYVAKSLGDSQSAATHFETALKFADQGLLDHLKWRALAGLGKLKEALDALESITIFNAGCGNQEITSAFFELVYDLVQRNEAEAAFNLAELLSELERFNRMAFLIADIPDNEKTLYRKLYPRLELLLELQEKLAAASGEEQQYLKDRIDRELEIVKSALGTTNGQWSVLILFGIAAHAEEVAESFVKTGEPALLETYQNLIKRYIEIQAELFELEPDVQALFGPAPYEAIDVMENLREDETLFRLFGTPEKGFIVFKVTPEEISGQLSVVSGQKDSGQLSVVSGSLYIAYENPYILSSNFKLQTSNFTYALSATHLVRSILNRKPFRRLLFSQPPLENPISDSEYTIVTSKDIANTLLLNEKIMIAPSVPTRSGEYPKYFPMVLSKNGQMSRLEDYVTPDLSLALTPDISQDAAYITGHLFSLNGCPSVVLNAPPLPQSLSQNSPPLPPSLSQREGGWGVSSFLSAYAKTSAAEAIKLSTKECGFFLLGYRGMTPEESEEFASAHFIEYAQGGLKAYNDGDFSKALSMLENAIRIAAEIESFQKHLPVLYSHARESAYQSGNMEKAKDYAELMVKLMEETSPDTESHAEAILRLGIIYANLEQYENAVPVLEQAAEIMANLELGPQQAAALAELGVVLENATEYDRALVQFESAAELSETLNKKEVLAGQYVNIGRIYDLRLSRYALAMQHYKNALAIYEEAGQTPKIAQSLLDIGRCYRLLGNFAEADWHFIKALQTAGEDQKNVRLKAKILIEQANNAWFQARYRDAFRLEHEAYEIAKSEGWNLMQVIAMNTSGLIWWTLGDNKRAMSDLEQALSMAKSLKVRDDEIASTLNNIGIVYREMGLYKEALSAFDLALEIDTKLKSRWAAAYDLRNKGLTLLRMNRPEDALPLFEKAVAEANAIGNRINEAKALLGLGEAKTAAGDLQGAEKVYEQALHLSQSMAIRETEWRALYGIAMLKPPFIPPKGGNDFSPSGVTSDSPEKLLYEAVDVIEEMRADIKIDQLKDSFIVNKLAVYEALILLLADQGKIVEAFEMAEQSRARNFIDLLGNQRLSLGEPVEQKLLERHNTLRSRIEEHESLIAQAATETEKNTYTQALEKINNEYRDLMLEIQVKNPQLATLVSVKPLGADELRSILEPGVVLLAYYLLPDEVFCWVVQRDRLELFRTPVQRNLLEEKILEYRRMIQNLEPLDEHSRELFRWLIAAAKPGLKDAKTVGIIPHGTLHYLSFGTLLDKNTFLSESFPLFYLPSASVWQYTLKRRMDEKNLQVLAIGNPDLGDPAFDLPFSEYEIESIGWNFPNITPLSKDKATESWVVQNIEKFGIIHMASHGEFDPINPLFSAIKLAKGGSDHQINQNADGNLEAAEVFGLKINADMVVLSACQTGLGKVTGGDDVIGLNRAFFYAGTHTVVSSLWRVSDVATAVLIKQFYRRYVTYNKAESLRYALLHVKQRYPHPGYWGAFTLVGDYF